MSERPDHVASAGSPPAGATAGPARIAELRATIDGLDQRIVALLAERTRVVRELTVHKSDEAAVRSPDRVRQVLDRVRGLADRHGMPPEVAVGTYRALIEELTRMQLDMLAARRAGTAPAGER
ncbi:chorismate mutase [Micromonospora auratinigra]|uniref:Isochorismate pyruvate lyase n=1 Tax=Micromonospora auratinigra TaxID=261654 RepID=A0A1A8ZH48_9ACTN|nr:chorismate mutase [Micromonospora auratinigra]SBT43359.1 isochorismate pyruvate lyase [Micromonospora auratinigra]